MGCCSSGQKRTAANTFYGDGDEPSQPAEEEKPPSPKPKRSASSASLFYNDGEEVEEETSFWRSSSKSKPSPKPSKTTPKKAETNGTKNSPKRTKIKGKGEQGGGNQRMNQIAPEAKSFYQNPSRIDNALIRRKTMQRAMNEAYDNKSVSSAESEDGRDARKKKSTSCFAGLCKPKETHGASNFHNQ